MTANAPFRARMLSRVTMACRRWQRDDRGATAVEFAMVATPFFMFCFGILGVGLHYFSTNSLEHAVEAAARKIRTGQAQNSGMTAGEFKALVCSEASGAIDCSKLRVHVQSGDDWSISPKACLDSDKKLAATAGSSSDKISDSSGEAAKVVLVTACYEWDLATVIPFIELGDMEGGASLIQAATTFRTEHYK